MRRLFFFLCFTYLLLPQAVLAKTIRIPKDYDSIQEGIDEAKDEDTILVSPGTYHENIDFQGKKIVLASHFILKGDSTKVSKTILDGSQTNNKDSASVVKFISGEDSSSAIIGFTIQNGAGTLILKPKGYGGGGILCIGSSPRIIHNIIKDNSAEAYGGGIYCQKSSAQIRQNVLTGNSTKYFGGGIVCNQASPKIEENILEYNSAEYARGGAIYCYSATPLVKRNLILENSCYLEGGGVCCESSSAALIVNNTFVRNQAAGGSGIGCIKSSSPKIVNNIISFGQGASVWCDKSSNPTLTHNVFWKKTDEIYGNCQPPREDNLFTDPLFVNPADSDYHLKKDSPLIDAGDTTLAEQDPDGTKPDVGAFYFHK